jgi:hypothetical protein
MDESPQATWKRVGPVLLTTLVPVVAALGFFALATWAKKTPDAKDRPSMAAFDACLTANDLQPAQSYATQFDETVASQQEMKTCGDKIPPDVIKKWQQQADAARSSYSECIKNLSGSSGSRGFGRFRGGPSSGFRSAFATCRSLMQQGGTDSGSAPAPKKKTTTVPGPIA